MPHPKLIAAEQAAANGDYGPMVALSLRAWRSGKRCECVEPELVGFDLMCRRCLLENNDQIAHLKAARATSHEYVPKANGRLGMCDFCSGWRNDKRHGEPVEEMLTTQEKAARELVDRIFPPRLSSPVFSPDHTQ